MSPWRKALVLPLCAAALLGLPSSMSRSAPSRPRCSPGWDQVISLADTSAAEGQRRIWVHHPAGPDNGDIPVLYVLHGDPADPGAVFDTQVRALSPQMCRTGLPFVITVPDGRSGDWDTE